MKRNQCEEKAAREGRQGVAAGRTDWRADPGCCHPAIHRPSDQPSKVPNELVAVGARKGKPSSHHLPASGFSAVSVVDCGKSLSLERRREFINLAPPAVVQSLAEVLCSDRGTSRWNKTDTLAVRPSPRLCGGRRRLRQPAGKPGPVPPGDPRAPTMNRRLAACGVSACWPGGPTRPCSWPRSRTTG